MSFEIENFLRCPATGSPLRREANAYISEEGQSYPVIQEVPVLLTPKEDPTLWVREASLHAAKEKPDDPWQEDTIGVAPEELKMLKAILRRQEATNDAVDPIISFLVGATSGLMYAEQIGKLRTIPIPKMRLPVCEGQNILLDIGCNWGRWSIAAAQAGYQVIGIDPSLGAVLAARRMAKSLGLENVSFVVGDALQLPFAPDTFDSIFSYSVLQHFSTENAIDAIDQAKKVSKPAAQLLIQMPNRFGIRCLYHQWKRRFRRPERFEVRYYSPSMLKKLFGTYFGPCKLSVDGYFGLGIQPSDRHMMSFPKKLVIDTSELLRYISRGFPPLVALADSLYISARRHRDASATDAAKERPKIEAY